MVARGRIELLTRGFSERAPDDPAEPADAEPTDQAPELPPWVTVDDGG